MGVCGEPCSEREAPTLSSPLERRSISAPNWWRAERVEGAGSESGSQSSWVSRVVMSVSVDPAEEWCECPVAGGCRCCGVDSTDDSGVFDWCSSRRHVYRRSTPEQVKKTLPLKEYLNESKNVVCAFRRSNISFN